MTSDLFPSQIGLTDERSRTEGNGDAGNPRTSAASSSEGTQHRRAARRGLTAPQCCEPEQLWQFQKAPYERNKDTTYSWRPCERWLWSHQSRPLGFSIVLQPVAVTFATSSQATCSQQSPRTLCHQVLSPQLPTGHVLRCKCFKTQTRVSGRGTQPFFCYEQPPTSANNEYTRHCGCDGASSPLPGTTEGSESSKNSTELEPTVVLGPAIS